MTVGKRPAVAGFGPPRRGRAAGIPRQALENLYRAFFLRLVRRAVCRYGLAEEDATEIVQEVFLLALVKLSSEKDCRGWLYRTMDNLAVNWKRKTVRRASLMAHWGSREHGSPEPASGQEETFADNEGGEP